MFVVIDFLNNLRTTNSLLLIFKSVFSNFGWKINIDQSVNEH